MKLRQVEALMGHGISLIDAIRQISVTEQTYYRCKKKRAVVRHWSENNGECGMGTEHIRELKRLKKDEQPHVCGPN